MPRQCKRNLGRCTKIMLMRQCRISTFSEVKRNFLCVLLQINEAFNVILYSPRCLESTLPLLVGHRLSSDEEKQFSAHATAMPDIVFPDSLFCLRCIVKELPSLAFLISRCPV
jgi:hypothetical protein